MAIDFSKLENSLAALKAAVADLGAKQAAADQATQASVDKAQGEVDNAVASLTGA